MDLVLAGIVVEGMEGRSVENNFSLLFVSPAAAAKWRLK